MCTFTVSFLLKSMEESKNPALRPLTHFDSEMMLKRSNFPSKMGIIVGLPTTLQYFFFLPNILRDNVHDCGK